MVHLVHASYLSLSQVARALFIERIGPEINREVFRLGEILEWKKHQVPFFKETSLDFTMHYSPQGPQSIFIRLNCRRKLRWAQFNFPRSSQRRPLKRNADGFFEGMWVKVTLELPWLQELEDLQTHIQHRTDPAETGCLQKDEHGSARMVLEGIVTTSYTHSTVEY